MGYMKHNAVIVTGWNRDQLNEAHSKAKEIFAEKFKDDAFIKDASRLVSEVVSGITNGQDSFFIAPDGSKEGWDTSRMIDEARDEFQTWLLNHPKNYSDYIEVRFGGDDEYSTIVRSKDSDLVKKADEER